MSSLSEKQQYTNSRHHESKIFMDQLLGSGPAWEGQGGHHAKLVMGEGLNEGNANSSQVPPRSEARGHMAVPDVGETRRGMQGTTVEQRGAPAGTWALEREHSCGAAVQLAEDGPGGDGVGRTRGPELQELHQVLMGNVGDGWVPSGLQQGWGRGWQEPFRYTPGPPVRHKACPRPRRFTRAGPTTRTEPATRAAVGFMWVRERLTWAHPSPPCGGREPPTLARPRPPCGGRESPTPAHPSPS